VSGDMSLQDTAMYASRQIESAANNAEQLLKYEHVLSLRLYQGQFILEVVHSAKLF